MNVTIIGAGNMARGIGTRLAAGGHSVTFVGRNPESVAKAAADVKTVAKKGAKVSTASLGSVELGMSSCWPYGTAPTSSSSSSSAPSSQARSLWTLPTR